MITSAKKVGTLLPMTALVSRSAESGTLAAGKKFIDWLNTSHQQLWQLLPLHQSQLEPDSQTQYVSSPYKGYGIGLSPQFLSSNSPQPSAKWLKQFQENNQFWLPDYALFCALRDHFGSDDWTTWPQSIRLNRRSARKIWQHRLKSATQSHILIQARLHLAYERFKRHAQARQVMLVGDFPLYLSLCSPLVWQYQQLFQLDAHGQPPLVSGVLAGRKSHFGRQVWGHPLYNWPNHSQWSDIEQLFFTRLKYLAGMFDWIRFDHVKGLFMYGAMDWHQNSGDQYLPGPGSQFLLKIINYARSVGLQVFAEDTGHNLSELRKCLSLHQVPGIKIFRFAFNEKLDKLIDQYALLDKYPVNCVAYTTTHDTEPLMAYLQLLLPNQRLQLAKCLGIQPKLKLTAQAKMIRSLVIDSPSKLVILPLQDWLLTTDRINIPGTEKAVADPNWRYRMTTPIEDLPTDLY